MGIVEYQTSIAEHKYEDFSQGYSIFIKFEILQRRPSQLNL